MIDSDSPSSLPGVDGHLRLFAPSPNPVVPMATGDPFQEFEPLNQAFQQATGWELACLETRNSRKSRMRSSTTAWPAIVNLSITDLSSLLPPGIPAVSRIYCEQLVEEFNKILTELGELRQRNHMTDVSQKSISIKESPLPASRLKTNVPYRTSNLALSPLHIQPGRATCEWFIDGSGIARFAAIVCRDKAHDATGELIAARATFLAECRHGTSNRATHEAIQESVCRVFPGDSELDILCGTINPLTGDITMVGLDPFRADSTNAVSTSNGGQEMATWHLQRGHHLVLSQWPTGVPGDEVDHWCHSTIGEFRHLALGQIADYYRLQMKESIPGLLASPNIAFSISRP